MVEQAQGKLQHILKEEAMGAMMVHTILGMFASLPFVSLGV